MANDVLLEVRNLRTYIFERGAVVKAVDGISYSIRHQETFGIVGESGCGKTMTAWSIMRLLPANARIVGGEIILHRTKGGASEVIDLAKLKITDRLMCDIHGGDMGIIFQEPMTSLSPLHTIGNQLVETLQLHERICDKDARERALHLLTRVGIPHSEKIIDEYSFQLSGGMRQRAMIAIALACRPSLLIADEPTTALDVTIQAQILNLMQKLQRDLGMAIMFITHNLAIIAQMANRVVVMYLGKIVESGPTEEIYYHPCHPYTQALLKSMPGVTDEPKTKLTTIRGSVPGPFAEIRGCAFFDRCPRAIPGTCNADVPVATRVAADHDVCCYLYR